MAIPLVYEDDWLLVVNKPSGLLTFPSLNNILNEDLEKRGIAYRYHACHRLDKDTSGLLIFAKGKSLQAKMMELFKAKKIKKEYTAFVSGRLPKLSGMINHPIEGKSAVTHYKVISQKKDFSVVEVTPQTGRTNQIRLHFKRLGSPVLGEDRFAFRRDFKVRAKKLCLHAGSLEFIHPETAEAMKLYAGLPAHMRELLKLK